VGHQRNLRSQACDDLHVAGAGLADHLAARHQLQGHRPAGAGGHLELALGGAVGDREGAGERDVDAVTGHRVDRAIDGFVGDVGGDEEGADSGRGGGRALAGASRERTE
jgi:hypothetical protein